MNSFSIQGRKMKAYKNIEMILQKDLPEVSAGFNTELGRIFNWIVDSITYIFHRNELRQRENFEKFVESIDILSKAGAVSMYVFDYVPDKGEYWQTPKETYERRSSDGDMEGDCDDLAGILTYCLNKNGYEAYMLVMWGKDKNGELNGHATCFLPKDRQTIGTFKRINHRISDEKAVAEYWYPELYGWILYRVKEDGYERIKGGIVAHTEKAEMTENLGNFVRRLKRFDPELEEIVKESLKVLT